MRSTERTGWTLALLAAALATAFAAGSCGPTYVRGDEVAGLDEYAMSTGLDKKDLEKLFDANVKSLLESALFAKWKAEPTPPIVALFPLEMETSEQVREPLDALLAKMETTLINGGAVTVIDRAMQDQMIEETLRQRGGAFDDQARALVGRQLGVKYFLTGKVYDSAERSEDERRVQYFLFMKIIEVETSAVRWQNEANLTKGLVD